MALDRAAILSIVPRLPREEVPVPEWGGSVWVRTLTASERDKLELEWEQTKRVHFRARLIVATACDEAGRNLFRPEDILPLGNHPTSVIQGLTDVALRLNRFTKEDIEDLEKNSEAGPSDGS